MLVKMLEDARYSENTFDIKLGLKDEIIDVADTAACSLVKDKMATIINDPTADMSPIGAAIFNCFKSSAPREQMLAAIGLVE